MVSYKIKPKITDCELYIEPVNKFV